LPDLPCGWRPTLLHEYKSSRAARYVEKTVRNTCGVIYTLLLLYCIQNPVSRCILFNLQHISQQANFLAFVAATSQDL
jgi:hypothetical protein